MISWCAEGGEVCVSTSKEDQSKKRRKLGVLLFIIGCALGMVLIGASIYADFESTLFDATTVVDSAIRPIGCPILLSSTELGKISAVVRNSDDRPREWVVRAHITRGHLILLREEEEKVALGSGDSQRLSWEVTADDAAYGHLIMAKVIVFDDAANPSHKGSCGIIVINLPGNLRGWQLFWILYLTSITCILSGIRIWWANGRTYATRSLEATRSILGLGGIILLGLVFIVFGFWELGAVAFYISLLLTGVIVPHFLLSR